MYDKMLFKEYVISYTAVASGVISWYSTT